MDVSFTDRRSAMHFLILAIFAGAVMVYTLHKAKTAVEEIRRLSEAPVFLIRKGFDATDKEIRPTD